MGALTPEHVLAADAAQRLATLKPGDREAVDAAGQEIPDTFLRGELDTGVHLAVLWAVHPTRRHDPIPRRDVLHVVVAQKWHPHKAPRKSVHVVGAESHVVPVGIGSPEHDRLKLQLL